MTPGDQRKLIGASLIKAVFERAAYGCRLFCCWCAQDLDANYFWESLGFVPIAFRAGSTGKKRVHIFWQKRIDPHPVTPSLPHPITPSPAPYWYPFKTDQGTMREDRIVFPIPPGVHWSEVKAVEVPKERHEGTKAMRHEGKDKKRPVVSSPSVPACLRASVPSPGKVGILVGGRIKYVHRPGYVAPVETKEKAEKTARVKARKAPAEPIDPKFLAAARELRDRYLEHVNGERGKDRLNLPATAEGKYDVRRSLLARAPDKPVPLLKAG